MSRHDYDLHPIDAPDFDLAEWMWCTKWCKENDLSPYDAEIWAKAKTNYKATQERKDMSNKLLKIDHIEAVGLIAEDGSELAKAFSNTYMIQAINQIADQDPRESIHFMGSLAGHSLAQMFSQLNIEQLDSVLAQIRTFVIQTQGS